MLYGFSDDKSKWNLGTWETLTISKLDVKPGLGWNDDLIASEFPYKYVSRSDAFSEGLLQVLGASFRPVLSWEVVNYQDSETELTEDMQEDAAKISSVFFQNEHIYVVFNQKPNNNITLILKGA